MHQRNGSWSWWKCPISSAWSSFHVEKKISLILWGQRFPFEGTPWQQWLGVTQHYNDIHVNDSDYTRVAANSITQFKACMATFSPCPREGERSCASPQSFSRNTDWPSPSWPSWCTREAKTFHTTCWLHSTSKKRTTKCSKYLCLLKTEVALPWNENM